MIKMQRMMLITSGVIGPPYQRILLFKGELSISLYVTSLSNITKVCVRVEPRTSRPRPGASTAAGRWVRRPSWPGGKVYDMSICVYMCMHIYIYV